MNPEETVVERYEEAKAAQHKYDTLSPRKRALVEIYDERDALYEELKGIEFPPNLSPEEYAAMVKEHDAWMLRRDTNEAKLIDAACYVAEEFKRGE